MSMFFLTLNGDTISAAGYTWLSLHSCTCARIGGLGSWYIRGQGRPSGVIVNSGMTIEYIADLLRQSGQIT